MTPQLVSLLACLLVGSSWAAFPVMPGFGNPFMSGNPYQFNQNHNQQQVNPHLITCINADDQDHSSEVRLTIKPIKRGVNPFGPPMGGLAMGLGNMGGLRRSSKTLQDWSVSGIMLPSQVVEKTGTYRVGVFLGGRTKGECKMSALGEEMTGHDHMNPFGPGMGMGVPPFSPLGLRMNPMYGMALQNQQRQPAGVMSSTAIITRGTTVFSGLIRQVAYHDLLGHSIAVCEHIHNRRCYGKIAYCCTMGKDTLPASQVFVEPVVGTAATNAFNPFGAQQGAGLLAGAPVAGAFVVGDNDALNNALDNDNGLF